MSDHPNEDQQLCQVALMPSGRQGKVARGTNLLQAARQLGVELESICGGRQTCLKCQVIVEQGSFPKLGLHSSPEHLTPPAASEAALSAEQLSSGRRLACAAEVLGDLLLTVPEESQARKQIIAKAASQRVIEVDPALRQVYVEVQAAEMSDPRGDLERLQEALREEWGLENLSIDALALPGLQDALREGEQAVTVTVWQEQQILRVEPGYREGLYGLAVDVGSTTVAAHLCDLRTGAVLATEAAMNPQVRYGEDLMSRVSYANSEAQGLARLKRAITRTLNELAERSAQSAGIDKERIMDMVVVGNTIMHHILLNIHPRELGGAPFALATSSALDLKASEIGLELGPAARLHLLPLIAGHVGADNVAVQLAEAPQEQDEIMLVVDVGTNAEIVLGDRQQVLVASSPTGPAFEGAQITHGQRAAPGAVERVRIDRQTLEPSYRVIGHEPWITGEAGEELPEQAKATGICGSGIIEAVAELYLAGILNERGLFEPAMAERCARLHYKGRTAEYVLVEADQSATGAALVVTQNDVRQIQLAKAALYAGAKLLMKQRGVEKVDRVVLAGAFGSFISPLHAMVLGLIPDCELERVTAVGNAAGDGARLALLNRGMRLKAVQLARAAVHVSTPLEASFQDEFVAALNLPHARDAYPHLADILPERAASSSNGRRQLGRRRQERRQRQGNKNTL
jgi:uncharacterized 2Fe-2S/4Fe-4S cluster protein (DUF4445 family)